MVTGSTTLLALSASAVTMMMLNPALSQSTIQEATFEPPLGISSRSISKTSAVEALSPVSMVAVTFSASISPML